MQRFATLLSLVVLFAGLVGCQSVSPKEPATSAFDSLQLAYEGVSRDVLANGMITLVAEDHSAPAVSIQIWIGAGSIHESEYLGAGLSHAIEHMIFKGTPTRDVGAITREINNAGGDINAYTSFDRTVFHTDLPASDWETGLDVLADAVMHAHFPEEEWVKEREVILREIDMHADNPDRALGQLLWATAYREHPYRHPVIGYKEVFSRITPDDLRTFFARHYTPDNMIVVVAGAVHPAEAHRAIRNAFDAFERRARGPVFIPEEPPQLAPRVTRKSGPYEATRLTLAWHTVPLTHPDAAPLAVLASIVGHGRTSRLVADIQEERHLVHSISAWSFSTQHPGLFGISVRCDPALEAEAVAAIEANIQSWALTPFTHDEIDKARRQILRSQLASLRTMSGLARHVGSGQFYAGCPRFSETYLQQLAAVTPAMLTDVAQRYLRTQTRTMAALSPAAPIADEPPLEHVITPVRTAPEVMVLSNGLRLIVFEDSRLPFVHFCAALGGGLLSESEANNGITRLMARLLTRGTTHRTAEALAQMIEARAGSISPFSGRNSFGLEADCMREDVPLFFELMADALINPVFDPDQVAREKTLQTAAIAARQERPFTLAQAELDALLFPGHPYRMDERGTPESVAALERTAIAEHFTTLAVAGNTVLAVFGDIDAATARDLAERHFSRMPRGQAVEPRAQTIERTLPARVKQRRPHEQSILLAGFPGTALGDPRRDALDLLSQALSGLASPLAMEIREKRGLAYYAGSYHQPGLDTGAFVFYAGTREDALDAVETLIREQIAKLINEGLDDDVFERTRRRMIARHQRALQQLGNVAMSSALNELYGIGLDRFFGMPERLQALTKDDVRQAANAVLDTDAMAISILMPENTTDSRGPQ